MRRYGPNDPTTAPTTVTTLAAHKWPGEVVRPLPTALVEQRRQINTRALEAR